MCLKKTMTSTFVTAALAAGLLLSATTGRAQELTVSDSDANTLLQVNDEGDAGSLTLPPAPSAPVDTANKLHNTGGALYWQDAQLGVWTRTGSAVHLTNASDSVGIGVADPDARLEVAGQVKITGGSPGIEKVLASGDAEGLAAWMTLNLPKIVSAQGNQYVCFLKAGLAQIFTKRKSSVRRPSPFPVREPCWPKQLHT